MRRLSLLAVVATCLLAGRGWASAIYPPEIQKQLSLDYTPQCSICHANGVTGYGTVTTPFGTAMRARGLVCCNLSSLDTALAALEGENSPYITYLKEGLDPNNPGAGAVPPPSYGCFNVSGQGPTAGAAAVVWSVLLLAALSRRTPRH